jgi:hypothetical protein
MGKKSDPDPRPGMNILDNISESLDTLFWVKNTSGIRDLLDPGSGIRDGKIWIRNNIPYPQHC